MILTHTQWKTIKEIIRMCTPGGLIKENDAYGVPIMPDKRQAFYEKRNSDYLAKVKEQNEKLAQGRKTPTSSRGGQEAGRAHIKNQEQKARSGRRSGPRGVMAPAGSASTSLLAQ